MKLQIIKSIIIVRTESILANYYSILVGSLYDHMTLFDLYKDHIPNGHSPLSKHL